MGNTRYSSKDLVNLMIFSLKKEIKTNLSQIFKYDYILFIHFKAEYVIL